MTYTKKTKISVIVPVYKVERFIRRCIDSILQQTYINFELLLIDDGSPDNSGKICDEYSQKDDRVQVYHTLNQGVTAARKYGVVHSVGEWITFVDSDDTIEPEALSSLLSVLNKGDYDIIGGTVRSGNEITYYSVYGEMSSIEFIEALLSRKINVGPYSKLFKRNLFDKIDWCFPKEITNNEDLLMLLALAMHTKRAYFSDHLIVYNYIKRFDGISHVLMPVKCWLKLFEIIQQILNSSLKACENPQVNIAFFRLKINRLYRECIAKGVFIQPNISNLLGGDVEKFYTCLSFKDHLIIWVIKHPFLQHLVYRYFCLRDPLRDLIKPYICEIINLKKKIL